MDSLMKRLLEQAEQEIRGEKEEVVKKCIKGMLKQIEEYERELARKRETLNKALKMDLEEAYRFTKYYS